VHLTDDVKLFGPLDGISCIPFENYLKQLKKAVHSSNLPFQQVISRLSEVNRHGVSSASNTVNSKPSCSRKHDAGPVPDGYEMCIQFESVSMDHFTVNLSDRDNCVIVGDSCVGLVRNILFFKSEIYLVMCLFQMSTICLCIR